jgi:hypothetical protein
VKDTCDLGIHRKEDTGDPRVQRGKVTSALGIQRERRIQITCKYREGLR